ncbi:MAG: Endonuclease III, partial [uncultured Blastococcus sp.]
GPGARGDPSGRALRAGFHQRLRAPGRDGAVGADHGQDGQQGDADAVRPVPRRGRARRGRPGRAGDHPQADGLLPGEGELGAGPQPGAGRALRRRGPRPHGRPGDAPRGRAEDGQRGARQRVRRPGPHGRHPLRAAGPPLRLDRRRGPGEGRGRDRRPHPEEGVDRLQPPGDLPRSAGVPRQEGGLRCVRTGAVVPLLRHRPGRPGGRPEAGQVTRGVGHRM